MRSIANSDANVMVQHSYLDTVASTASLMLVLNVLGVDLNVRGDTEVQELQNHVDSVFIGGGVIVNQAMEVDGPIWIVGVPPATLSAQQGFHFAPVSAHGRNGTLVEVRPIRSYSEPHLHVQVGLPTSLWSTSIPASASALRWTQVLKNLLGHDVVDAVSTNRPAASSRDNDQSAYERIIRISYAPSIRHIPKLQLLARFATISSRGNRFSGHTHTDRNPYAELSGTFELVVDSDSLGRLATVQLPATASADMIEASLVSSHYRLESAHVIEITSPDARITRTDESERVIEIHLNASIVLECSALAGDPGLCADSIDMRVRSDRLQGSNAMLHVQKLLDRISPVGIRPRGYTGVPMHVPDHVVELL